MPNPTRFMPVANDDHGIALRSDLRLNSGNVHELAAELRLDALDVDGSIECKTVEDAIHTYQTQKGWFDNEDWLDQAMAVLARFCLNARDIGAQSLRFEPVTA